MGRKYTSQRTRAAHRYSFYRKRRNDPKWRADFLEARASRLRHILINMIVILSLILLALFTGYGKKVQQLLNGPEQAAQVTTVHESSAHEAVVGSAEQPNSQSKSVQTSDEAKTVIINDYQHYASYSGEYGSEEQTASLDFSAGTFTTTGPQKQQIFYFDKVMRHPDMTLIINMHGNYRYNAYQGKGEQSKPVYISLLFVPQNHKITRNWQSGESFEDTTNTKVNRFSIAKSNDGGKVFQMAPAYVAFADNLTSGGSLGVVYSEAN